MCEPEILAPESRVDVIARPHPLSLETHRLQFRHGVSIQCIVGDCAISVRVQIAGEEVPRRMWPHVRPKPGVMVAVIRFPQGGSAKSIFRLIAFAALAVGVTLISAGTFAPGIAAAFAHLGITAGFTAGSLSAGLLAAGFGLVGSLFINALVPPSTGQNSSSSGTNLLSSITGTSNQLERYGTIPCVVGTVLYYPTYAALPFTELLGDDQYLHCLFDLGSGDPTIADLKIGDTDLASYTDVETEISYNPTLFSQDILEEAVGADLNADASTATRTTGTGADETSVDVVFASGLFGVNSDGHTTTVTVSTRLEYRVTGSSGAWTSVAAAPSGYTLSNSAASFDVPSGNLLFRNAERKAVRVGVRWKNPTKDQYDIRYTRNSTDWGGASSDSEVGDMAWTVLRTIRYTNPSTTGTKKLAMRIKATDQLNGNLQQFNGILSQPIPCWHDDTSTWVTEPSTNPAFIFRWILKDCPANPRLVDISRIDDDEIKAWAVECAAKNFTYAKSIDPTTVFALLKEIAAAGRASFTIRDGKYSVVRDVAQATPVQVFTPRNTWAFGGNRAFPDVVHALRVQFSNPEASYQQDERVVYDDGYGDAAMVEADPTLTLATNFEQLTLPGCVDADGAWRLGRYHLAVSRLRANTYFWSADVENLVCNRGDLVRFAHDIIDAGLAWGKVKAVILDTGDNPPATGIVTDEEISAEEGKTYAVRIRRQDASVVVAQLVFTSYGDGLKRLTFTAPVTGLNPDDLFCFGELGQDSIPLIISKIEPGPDYTAKLTAVDQASAVLDADAGDPPAWSSQITGQPWLEPPPIPEVVGITSSQSISPIDDVGNTSVTLVITFGHASGKIAVDHTELRYRRTDPVGAWTNLSLTRGQLTIAVNGDFEREVEYDLEARNIGTNGSASEWVQVTHTVAGKTIGPLAIDSLAAYQLFYGVRLVWTVAGAQRADAQYEVQRTGDSSGSPIDADWAQIAVISALTYTDSIPITATKYWYRVRALSGGIASDWAFVVAQEAVDPGGGSPPGPDPEPGIPY